MIWSGLCMEAIWLHLVRKNLLSVPSIDETVMARVNRRLLGGPALYFVAIVISLTVPGGTEIAFGIYIVTLVYYVVVSSVGRIMWRIGGTPSPQRP